MRDKDQLYVLHRTNSLDMFLIPCQWPNPRNWMMEKHINLQIYNFQVQVNNTISQPFLYINVSLQPMDPSGFRFHSGAARCVSALAGQWSESERAFKSDQAVLGARAMP